MKHMRSLGLDIYYISLEGSNMEWLEGYLERKIYQLYLRIECSKRANLPEEYIDKRYIKKYYKLRGRLDALREVMNASNDV